MSLYKIYKKIRKKKNSVIHNFHYKFSKRFHINLSKFLDSISEYLYVIIKTQTDYMPKNFPKIYPIGKDIDILTTKEDYKKIVKEALLFSKDEENKKFNVKIKEDDIKFRLRYEYRNQLHFLIEIMDKFY